MLDPLGFAHSVDSYLESLPEEELRALVFRSVKRLDGAHRTQLALFLGHDFSAHPLDEVGGSSLNDQQLRAFIESCSLLRERYAAFLRENPRAIRALGKTTAARMMGAEDGAGYAEERVPLYRRIPLKGSALIALVLIVAFLPLAAQYVHQRGIIAGLSEISIVPPIGPGPASAVRVPAKAAPQRVVTIPAIPVRHAPAPAHHARARPVVFHHRHPRHIAVHSRVRHMRVASVWKFDPQYNAYFTHNWRGGGLPRASAPRAGARRTVSYAGSYANDFSGRASLVVTSYLDAVIRGNTKSALEHLGLPDNASVRNVRESPIVSRDMRARVISVKPDSSGVTRVEVELMGPTGEYFEVFSVARDGGAVRITDRYYIPVNRTAEERAASLLAKDGH